MPRTTLHRLRLALLGAGAVALVLVALGGAANGGNFILGQANTATATTSLSGNTPGPQLKVVNANTSNHTILAQAGGGTGIALYGQHTTTTGAGPALRGDSASTAAGAFSLYGLLSASAPGSPSAAIRAESKSTSANGYGLWATQAGSGIGVYATSPNGTGVLGKHTGGANTGTGPGVEGDSASPENAGVIGKNTAGGPGLQAIVNSNSIAPLKVNSAAKVPSLNADLLDGFDSTNFVRNNPPITLTGPGGEDVLTAKNMGNGRGLAGFSDTWQGVYGHSNSNAGVVGEATNFDGVWGQAHLPTTAGVSGHNYAGGYGVSGDATGNGIGVYATSDSGDAVQAISASGEGVGVRGTSTSCCSAGVYGFSTGHVGVYGVGNVGVVGVSEGTVGEAGAFSGHVTITKGLTVTGGCTGCTSPALKIDDPRDPAHEYLQHAAVASPDMKDVYDGVATTDAKGFATVRLPGYFQALNRSFRYQLTSLSGLQEVAVAKEITRNRFTIQSQKPHSRISWQVTGIRHDRYANAHRLQVVVPKSGAEQGKYLNPELYGKPKAAAIGYRKAPRLPAMPSAER